MTDNLTNFDFQRLTLIRRRGGKTTSIEDRNIRNNLVKFANNLPFRYFKAPQKQQRFDGKK